METMLRNMLVSLALIVVLPACSATPSPDNPTSVTELKSNTAYMGPDGTVLVKGFGGRYTANFLCILPSGSYRITVDTSTKGSMTVGSGGTAVGGSLERDTKAALAVLHEPHARTIAVQLALGNACVLLGNGIFGDTCTKCPKDTAGSCSGGAPSETLERYNEFVVMLIKHLLPEQAKPAGEGEPVNSTEQATPGKPAEEAKPAEQ
jgi:hypothetical protein